MRVQVSLEVNRMVKHHASADAQTKKRHRLCSQRREVWAHAHSLTRPAVEYSRRMACDGYTKLKGQDVEHEFASACTSDNVRPL